MRQHVDRAQLFGQGGGDLVRVPRGPDPGAVDAGAPAVQDNALDHHVEVLLPVVDHVVTDQDLAETGAVNLNPRVPRVLLDRGRATEDEAAVAAGHDSTTDVVPARIETDGLRRDAGLDQRLAHTPRRPGLLRAGLHHESDLQRQYGHPERVHTG